MQSQHKNVSLTSLTKVSLFVRNSHKLSYRASHSGWNNIFSPNSTKEYVFLTNSIYPMFSFCKYVDIDWSPRKFSKSMTYTQILPLVTLFTEKCLARSKINMEVWVPHRVFRQLFKLHESSRRNLCQWKSYQHIVWNDNIRLVPPNPSIQKPITKSVLFSMFRI